MSENIQLPDQSFPTTEGELNLTQIESEWLVFNISTLKIPHLAVQLRQSVFHV